MEIIILRRNGRKKWNEVALKSEDAWFAHLYDWVRIEEDVWNRKSYSFMIESDNKILGIFPLFLQKMKALKFFNSRLLLSSGMASGGPAIVPDIGQKQRVKTLNAMFDYTDRMAKERGIDELKIILPTLAPANLPDSRPNVNPLIFNGLRDVSTSTYIIDLSKNIDSLWSDIEARARRAINNSVKEKIKISKAENLSDVKDYYKIHVETYKRTGAKPHPFSYFKSIWNFFGTKGIANIFFAEHMGERIAYLNVGAFKTGSIYWTGCSKTEYINMRPNNLLQWHAIRWAKKKGFLWYETGEAFPNARDEKLRGLTLFKKSFGGEIYPFYKGIKFYRPYRHVFFSFIRGMKEEYGGMNE